MVQCGVVLWCSSVAGGGEFDERTWVEDCGGGESKWDGMAVGG